MPATPLPSIVLQRAETKATQAARLAESCQTRAAVSQAEVLMALEENKQATSQALEVRCRWRRWRCCHPNVGPLPPTLTLVSGAPASLPHSLPPSLQGLKAQSEAKRDSLATVCKLVEVSPPPAATAGQTWRFQGRN